MAINPTWLNFDTPRAVFASASQEAARRAATELAQRQQQIDQQEFAQTMAQRAALASLEQQGRAQQIALQQQNLAQEMAQNLIRNELERDRMQLAYKTDLASQLLRQKELDRKVMDSMADQDEARRLEALLGTEFTNNAGETFVRTGKNTVVPKSNIDNAKKMAQLREQEFALRSQLRDNVTPTERQMLKEQADTIRNSVESFSLSPEEINEKIRQLYEPYLVKTQSSTSLGVGGSGGVRTITTKEEYDKLPSGTEYIGPSGKKAVKP